MYNRIIIALTGCMVMLASCSPSSKSLRKNARVLLASPALANAHTGIAVYDLATDKPVYNYQSGKYFVPASNVKLATCYAVMKFLGDSLPALQYAKDVNGTMLIAGTGDPTLLHPDFTRQPVIEFLKKHPLVTWKEPLVDEPLGSGWSWDDYNEEYMVQRSALPVYGNVVRLKFADGSVHTIPSLFEPQLQQDGALTNGFHVSRNWDDNTFHLMPGSAKQQDVPFYVNPGIVKQILQSATGSSINVDGSGIMPAGTSTIYSQLTDSMLRPMMFRSDNFFAEQSLMMVGKALLGRFDVQGTTDTLLKAQMADLPQKPRWVDGSGLSRYNLFTPADMVSILKKISLLPRGLDRMKAVLPTGGQGTFRNYFVSDSSFIYGKTGTLSGVVALSGLLYTKKGKPLLFSILVNNNRASATDVRRAVEQFVLKIREEY